MGLVSFHSTSPLLPFLPSWVFCSGLAGLLAVSHPNQEPRVCGLRAGFSLCPFLCLLFVAVVIVSLLSYVWLCDPMDCSPPGSSVHGIFQARILEWVAIYSSRGASWLRNRTHVSSLRLSYLGSPTCWKSVLKSSFLLKRTLLALLNLQPASCSLKFQLSHSALRSLSIALPAWCCRADALIPSVVRCKLSALFVGSLRAGTLVWVTRCCTVSA